MEKIKRDIEIKVKDGGKPQRSDLRQRLAQIAIFRYKAERRRRKGCKVKLPAFRSKGNNGGSLQHIKIKRNTPAILIKHFYNLFRYCR